MTVFCPGVWGRRGEGVKGVSYMCSGKLSCQVFLAAKRVLAVVDGIAQFLQHHIQRGVLRKFHHEHAGLHPNVA